MDNIGKVKLNDVIYSAINTKLAVMNLCATLEKDSAIEVIKHVCDQTRDTLITEIMSEDHADSFLREFGHDPKDIANEIARQINSVSIDLIDDVKTILSDEQNPEEN